MVLGLSPSLRGRRKDDIVKTIVAHESRLSDIDGEISRLEATLAQLQKPSCKRAQESTLSIPRWLAPARLLQHFLRPESMSRRMAKADITATREALLRAASRRERVSSDLQTLVRTRAPVHCVPVEIWIEIFRLALPPDTYIRPDPNTVPLVLTRVCAQWRNIAVAMPELWASGSFRVEACRHAYNAMTQAWLARSGTVPLALKLRFRPTEVTILDDAEADYDLMHSRIFHTFANSAHRWRSACLHIPARILEQVFTYPMPMLETLQLHTLHSPPFQEMSIAAVSPRLCSFTLLSVNQDPFTLDLPWGILTHFHCRTVLSFNDALTVLRDAPNLLSCTLHVCIPAYTYPPQPPITTRLRALALTSVPDGVFDPFLGAVATPHLRHLELTHRPGYSAGARCAWPRDALEDMLTRSDCALARLCLRDLYVREEDLKALVYTVPSLVAVEVECRGLSKVFSPVVC